MGNSGIFKKKSRPELYEILQTNKSGSGAGPQKKGEITSVPALTAAPEVKTEPHPAHPAVVNSTPYPNWKVPSATGAKPQEQKPAYNLSKYALPALLVLALAVVVVLIVYQLRRPADRTTQPGPNVQTAYWANQMAYFPDTVEGQRLVSEMVNLLKSKGVKEVLTQKKPIRGVSYVFIYAGKYATKEEGIKDKPNLKQLHQSFKYVDTVEVK